MKKILIVDMDMEFARNVVNMIPLISNIIREDILLCTPDEAMVELEKGNVSCISTELLLHMPKYKVSIMELMREVFGGSKIVIPEHIRNGATFGKSDFGGINFIRNVKAKYNVPICVFSLMSPWESHGLTGLVYDLVGGGNFLSKTEEDSLYKLSQFLLKYKA